MPLKALFLVLVISHFDFEGGVWVLITSVPGHCILVTCTFVALVGGNLVGSLSTPYAGEPEIDPRISHILL